MLRGRDWHGKYHWRAKKSNSRLESLPAVVVFHPSAETLKKANISFKEAGGVKDYMPRGEFRIPSPEETESLNVGLKDYDQHLRTIYLTGHDYGRIQRAWLRHAKKRGIKKGTEKYERERSDYINSSVRSIFYNRFVDLIEEVAKAGRLR